MTEDRPAEGENQALAQRKNGGVRGLLQHKESLEELVQRMRRIREAEMPKRVGDQEVAEIVGNIRRWNWILRQQCEPERDGQAAPKAACTNRSFEPGAGRTERSKAVRSTPIAPSSDSNDDFDEIARAEADRIQVRQERSEQMKDIHRLLNLFET